MEERKEKGVDKKERRKGDVKIGGRVASGMSENSPPGQLAPDLKTTRLRSSDNSPPI